ncbi:small ribosomal subunit protein mS25 [Danaus plexippus]|uniref:Small ribosomal subunit protein mS25 n=1 Tax=Danaus plexippus plexippus TaxID=278856 RepID=A0A212ELB1_DANPL|nr:small ribosomal subunit protein mS25 [Danaus plexippus]OWR42274.1 mitochondrial ribosomal protein S25 [Danaus plexippus plexippus]
MPFMKGRAPIRRTLDYLNAGKLVLKDKIKIFSVAYNIQGQNNVGAKEFVFWYLPQIQYKNPDVQVATLKNLTPSPFIKCYFDDGRQILVDIDNKSKEDIMEHLLNTVGKSQEVLAAEAIEKEDNPANFGTGCQRPCICEIYGQVPCPGVVPLPKFMRGKYKNQTD